MNRILAILLFAVAVMCGGCYDKVELNELAVAEMIGLDLSEDGRVLVSVQFVIPGEISSPAQGSGPTHGTPFYVVEATGATIPEALSFLQAKVPRRLFTSHVRVIVLGEELAKTGVGPVFDSLTRERELRVTSDVVVARGRAADILRASPSLEKLPSAALRNLLNQRIVPSRSVRKFAIALIQEGVDPFLPVVELAERTEPQFPGAGTGAETGPSRTEGEFEITGIAVFRDDRLVGFVPREVARGLAWLIDEVTPSTTSIEWPPRGRTEAGVPPGSTAGDGTGGSGGSHTSESPGSNLLSQMLLHAKTRLTPEVRDGEIVIRVAARSVDDIVGNQAGLDLSDPSVIPPLERAIAERIESRMREILDLAQGVFQADIFGFGALVHRKHPKLWREIRSDWREIFSRLKVEISVEVHVKRVGLSNRPATLTPQQLQR